jgi:putative ABC transport system permease protein
MFYELVQLAVGNLARARARLVMTAGGVLVGTSAVVLLIALTIGLQQAAEAGIGQSGSLTEIQVWPNWGRGPGSGGSTDEIPQLTIDTVRSLWQIDGVLAVLPITNLQSGQLEAGDYMGFAQIMGIDPQLLPYLGVEMQQGQLAIGQNQVVAGALVSEQFYDPTAEEWQPITVDLMNTPLKMIVSQWSGQSPVNRDFDLTINGVLAPGNSYDYSIFMPIDQVVSLNEWATGQEIDPKTFTFDQVIVRTTSREATNEVSNAIREMGFMPGGMGEFLNQLNGFFTTLRLVLGAVGGVALLVAAFGVANTMTMAILERTREIGLMKAIGATDREVLTVFLIEAGLVGFTGGAAGLGVALFLQNVVNQALANAPQNTDGSGMGFFLPIDPSQIGGNLVVIPTELAVFALVLATAVGLGAGLFPALRAARLQPVIALKSE